MSNQDQRNSYKKDEEKRHYGMGEGWAGNGDEEEPKHKSDLLAAAEGALIGGLGGALIGGIGGVAYNEYEKHKHKEDGDYQHEHSGGGLFANLADNELEKRKHHDDDGNSEQQQSSQKNENNKETN